MPFLWFDTPSEYEGKRWDELEVGGFQDDAATVSLKVVVSRRNLLGVATSHTSGISELSFESRDLVR